MAVVGAKAAAVAAGPMGVAVEAAAAVAANPR